jgi:hypothetical protein
MGMLVLLAILIGLSLLRATLVARASERGFRDRRALLWALLISHIVSLFWTEAMRLGVGPAVRGI